jgi:hypothetical protein
MCWGWGLTQTRAAKRVPFGKLKVVELAGTGLAGVILSGTVGTVVVRLCGAGAEQAISSAIHVLAMRRKRPMRFSVIALVYEAKKCTSLGLRGKRLIMSVCSTQSVTVKYPANLSLSTTSTRICARVIPSMRLRLSLSVRISKVDYAQHHACIFALD